MSSTSSSSKSKAFRPPLPKREEVKGLPVNADISYNTSNHICAYYRYRSKDDLRKSGGKAAKHLGMIIENTFIPAQNYLLHPEEYPIPQKLPRGRRIRMLRDHAATAAAPQDTAESSTKAALPHANFHQLIDGFHNFKESYLLREREFFRQLSYGQNPRSLVIACCDSRVDPAILLGVRPGELFVVRSIAALVPSAEDAAAPDAVMAAVEYGVKHLDVDHIIVMGHSSCGGIHGALFPEKIEKEAFIRRWVALASPVTEELRREMPDAPIEELARRSEEGAVLQSIENLLSYDWLAKKIEAGSLSLHALYYDLRAGSLYVWNAEKEDFELSTGSIRCPTEENACRF